MDAEPERFLRLRANCKVLHVGLLETFKGTKFEVNGSEFSPIQHVYYRDDDREVMEKKLNELVDQMFEKSIVLTRARYLDKEEVFPIRPSIRVMAQSELTENEMEHFLKTICEVLQAME
ncbi:Serine palmitoyltransferase 1 [Toxocara canis]|uniref:Serine palmitoyltransferase 1 n=1 Tax=Toxocara canis TaxID=6265 RepID=A0A0B2VCI3_TOXCA|nr:Serine palmitoyltransferase 1 [Toxocara canis]